MLKLKYLFNNKDLAFMILNNWEQDFDSPNPLEYYRISANAIYWCKNQGNTFFLRFTPTEEKSKEKILAEIEFLRYLKNNNYSAVETILSKAGNELETVTTPWGNYYALALKKAPGRQISEIPLTDALIFGYGETLGKLHKLSSEFNPTGNKRDGWKETLNWMEQVLSGFPEEVSAKSELNMLRNYFSKLPMTKDNFGLIHYDFEPDNVFYDDLSKTYTPIDFDDTMYHWYALDFGQALESIKENVQEFQTKASVDQFIKGYRSAFHISDEMLKLLPIFKRYTNLYGYVRILRSAEEKWNNEPDWLVGLRIKFKHLLNIRKENFAKPL